MRQGFDSTSESKSFLASLCYLYLTDESFQTMCEALDIKPDKIAHLDLSGIIIRYQKLKSEFNHATALFELQNDISFIDHFGIDIKLIPRDEKVLRDYFNKHSKVLAYECLGRMLITSPMSGDELVEEFREKFDKGNDGDVAEISDIVEIEYSSYHERAKLGKTVISIQGFEKLSEMIGGFNPGRLILLMAETGFGKTNLGMALFMEARKSLNVLYINMEMIFEDMALRAAVYVTQKEWQLHKNGNVTPDEVSLAMGKFTKKARMTGGRIRSLSSILSLIRSEHKNHGIDLVFIDYDQKIDLVISKDSPEWKAIQKAIVSLESIAKELEFCCVVMAQQNRMGELSGSHRALFTAHTVLEFKGHKSLGAVIEARKNRHGHKGAAVRINYNTNHMLIKEMGYVDLKDLEGDVDNISRVRKSKSHVGLPYVDD